MFLLLHPWLTTTNLSYSFPHLETSATALCGTTGMMQFLSKSPQRQDPKTTKIRKRQHEIWQNSILETSGCLLTMKRLFTILLSFYVSSLCLIQTKFAHIYCNAFCYIRLISTASPPFCTHSLSNMPMEMAVLCCVGDKWSQRWLAEINPHPHTPCRTAACTAESDTV